MPIFIKTHRYEDNPINTYLSAFNAGSARTMRSALESVASVLSDDQVLADELAWHELKAPHLAALRAHLVRRYAPATANRYLTAVRGVLKTAWRLGLLTHEAMARTIDVSPIRGKRQPKGRVVKVDEIATLFETCAKDSNRALGNRDIAILAMLYGAGLRRAEVAELQVENVNIAEGRCKVIGKGNKERTVFLPPGTVNAVVEWLVNRGVKPGYLFNRVRKSGFVVVGRAINAQTVYDIVRLRHKKAGIKPFSPHDLRRSFISELLDAGVDLSTIARQVGHSNVQITARYDRRDEATQQRGVLQLNVPYGTMKGNDGVKTETDAE